MSTQIVSYSAGPINPRLSADDFDTASIRSAAPSYVSDAPSYHTLPSNEAVPPYTPRANPANTVASRSMVPPTSSESRVGYGLPPIPRQNVMSSTPSLSQFSIPSWSSIGRNNPQARHYQSVANRRVAAATASAGALSSSSFVQGVLRDALSRINVPADAYAAATSGTGDGARIRPQEDPYLVGEEEARRARNARLARGHEDVLLLEDQRWDSWLAQMRDSQERQQNWKMFRANLDHTSGRRKFARRFGR